jgi:hypothetical protein
MGMSGQLPHGMDPKEIHSTADWTVPTVLKADCDEEKYSASVGDQTKLFICNAITQHCLKLFICNDLSNSEKGGVMLNSEFTFSIILIRNYLCGGFRTRSINVVSGKISCFTYITFPVLGTWSFHLSYWSK